MQSEDSAKKLLDLIPYFFCVALLSILYTVMLIYFCLYLTSEFIFHPVGLILIKKNSYKRCSQTVFLPSLLFLPVFLLSHRLPFIRFWAILCLLIRNEVSTYMHVCILPLYSYAEIIILNKSFEPCFFHLIISPRNYSILLYRALSHSYFKWLILTLLHGCTISLCNHSSVYRIWADFNSLLFQTTAMSNLCIHCFLQKRLLGKFY